MTNPAVTVFIPTWNRADYLRETIHSVLNQTHQPVQLIVLDDASSDTTPEVVAKFASDPRFSSVRHPQNVGMAANWRAGLELVKTPYFCLLNDDDLLAPDCIEKLLAPMLADEELIVSFCDHWVIDGEGKVLEEATEVTAQRHGRAQLTTGRCSDFGEATVIHRSLHISCSLLRTALVPPEFIEKRAQGFACGWMFYQCYLTGHPAYYVSERLASYRVHDGNMIGNPAMSGYISDGQIFWCAQLLKDPLPEPLRSRTHAQVAGIYTSHAFSLLTAGRHSDAADFFNKALSIQPSLKATIGNLLNQCGGVGRALVGVLRQHFGKTKESMMHQFLPPMVSVLSL
ncbi:MAG TPA: glycosyltransferase family 2 protein [Chthoniobacterales bacterium]|jgi:hypothetical protein